MRMTDFRLDGQVAMWRRRWSSGPSLSWAGSTWWSTTPFLDTTVDELEAAFHLNVSAAFELVKLATPHLLDSGVGSVVNVSSAMDRMVGRGLLVYGTVKAALSHMTRLLAADLAPRVRANAIAAPRCQPSRTSSPICSGPRAVMAPICALILNA
jgi:NAD(P)-dependent dehydrogenase (short-subunit alcohol dehydrogenase family)